MLHPHINTLRELGLPEAVLTEGHSLHQTPDKKYHSGQERCGEGGKGVLVSYADLDEDNECGCVMRMAWSGRRLDQTVAQLAALMETIQVDITRMRLIERRGQLREYNSLYSDLRRVGRKTIELDETFLGNVRKRLDEAYGHTKASLRTPEAKEEMLQLVLIRDKMGETRRADLQDLPEGAMFLLGLTEYRPHATDALGDAIVAGHWETMRGTGNFPLVLPTRLAREVAHVIEDKTWPVAGMLQGPHRLLDTDTKEVLETASMLWEPQGEGPMGQILNALEAARLT